MEEVKGVVKRVLLAKFKPELSPDQVTDLVKGFANLVKSYRAHERSPVGYQRDMHQGFTHIFMSTFESTEGLAVFGAHPVHVEFANLFLPSLEKVIIFDYKPTFVLL